MLFISSQWSKNINGRNVQFNHFFIFMTCKIPVFVNVIIKITNPLKVQAFSWTNLVCYVYFYIFILSFQLYLNSSVSKVPVIWLIHEIYVQCKNKTKGIRSDSGTVIPCASISTVLTLWKIVYRFLNVTLPFNQRGCIFIPVLQY